MFDFVFTLFILVFCSAVFLIIHRFFGERDKVTVAPNIPVVLTKGESSLLPHIEQVLSGFGEINQQEAKKMSRQILEAVVSEAAEVGLRGVSNLGDRRIKDEVFLNKRLKAGLTRKDILDYWNRDYVTILLEHAESNGVRLAVFKRLVEDQKMSPQEASVRLRKMYLYTGDPEERRDFFVGQDADVFEEFGRRYEAWRSGISVEKEREIARSYSTYNAMVRDLIAKGDI